MCAATPDFLCALGFQAQALVEVTLSTMLSPQPLRAPLFFNWNMLTANPEGFKVLPFSKRNANHSVYSGLQWQLQPFFLLLTLFCLFGVVV